MTTQQFLNSVQVADCSWVLAQEGRMSVSADLIHIGLPDLATEVLAAEFCFFPGGTEKDWVSFSQQQH